MTNPTSIPATLTAGDSWQWTRSLDAFPADSWDLTVYLRGPATLDIPSTPGVGDPGVHVLAVAPEDTTPLAPGRYTWAERVSDGNGDVRTIATGVVDVRPNPATATAGQLQSHAARMVPLLEEALRRRVTIDQASYQILQRAATREDLREYERMLTRYRLELAAELAGHTRPGWRTISHQFRRPA